MVVLGVSDTCQAKVTDLEETGGVRMCAVLENVPALIRLQRHRMWLERLEIRNQTILAKGNQVTMTCVSIFNSWGQRHSCCDEIQANSP